MSDEREKNGSTATPPPVQQKTRSIEFVIELGDAKNGNHLLPINQRMLRGAWKHENTRNLDLDTDGQFAIMRQMRDIPGMCIHVSTSRRSARVFDPLGEPENKDLLENVATVVNKAFAKKCGPDKADHYQDLSADEIKTWLYWSRRFLDARQCTERQGSVPQMSEIMGMPGKIIRGSADESLTDDQRYRPMTHAESVR